LNETSLTKLRTAMREVITVGSGKALGSVAGKPVYGKTGTAEYGTDNPPRSHSWFAGWQGDIAFAVFIEDGGNEASLAIAAAKRFLAALNG
jgi:cell division protein FtsI/penicillin-binding protein 2